MTEQHDHVPQMANRSQIWGMYQNMLCSPSKAVPTGNAQLMQNVLDQIRDGVMAAEADSADEPAQQRASSAADSFTRHALQNPYGFNEFMDAAMICKMKKVFDNFCATTTTTTSNSAVDGCGAESEMLDLKHLEALLPLFGFFLESQEMEGLQQRIRSLYSTSAEVSAEFGGGGADW